MLPRWRRSRILVAVLFLVYWLATLAMLALTTDGYPPLVVLLVWTQPLIVGGLTGRWLSSMPEASSAAVAAGALAGALWGEVTLFVMKGGVVDELLHWRTGESYVGELLGWVIITGVASLFLGLFGAAAGAGFSEGRPVAAQPITPPPSPSCETRR